jgi:hypothetical protein
MTSKSIFFIIMTGVAVSCLGSEAPVASVDERHILVELSPLVAVMRLEKEWLPEGRELGTRAEICGGCKNIILQSITQYGDGRTRYFWSLDTEKKESMRLCEPQALGEREAGSLSCVLIGSYSGGPNLASCESGTWKIGELYTNDGKSFEFLGVLQPSSGRLIYFFLSLGS